MIFINGNEINLRRFPDNTLLVRFVNKSSTCTLRWKYESDDELFAIYCLKRHIDDNSKGRNITTILQMDYIPNARQDRVKNPEDVFTLKYFAEVINSMKFDSVEVLDPHSNVAPALINNVIVKDPADKIADAYFRAQKETNGSAILMFYPDEGACKRYSGLFSTPHAFGIKNRNWETGKIEGLSVFGNTELIAGNDILIIDDICSKGGTFYHSAKKLKELGANRIFLFVTHCENTILDGEVLDSGLVDKIYTTDSLFSAKNEKIEVIY